MAVAGNEFKDDLSRTIEENLKPVIYGAIRHHVPLKDEWFTDDKHPMRFELPTSTEYKGMYRTPHDATEHILQERHESAADLAEVLGVSKRMAQYLVKEPWKMSPKQVDRLSEHFGCSMRRLRGQWSKKSPDRLPNDDELLETWENIDDFGRHAIWMMMCSEWARTQLIDVVTDENPTLARCYSMSSENA